MNYRADMIDKQDGKTLLNFMIKITVLKIGKYPSKIDRIIKNAETETELEIVDAEIEESVNSKFEARAFIKDANRQTED